MSPSTRVVDAGVDWITATSRDNGLNSPLALQGRSALAVERDRGNLERPWRWNGYEGLTTGSATVAKRADGTIVRLSSTIASERWRQLVGYADNISRLDLQVTILDPDPHCARAAVAYAQSTLAKATIGRPWSTTLIVADPRGQTAYIGARASDKYGRVYDKGSQSKLPEDSNRWRYEVEYKRDVAATLGRLLAQSAHATRDAMALVGAFFERRGVMTPFRGCLSIDEPSASRRPSDTERALKWLRTQVAPTVARLIAAGYELHTRTALGIPTSRSNADDPEGYVYWPRLRDA